MHGMARSTGTIDEAPRHADVAGPDINALAGRWSGWTRQAVGRWCPPWIPGPCKRPTIDRWSTNLGGRPDVEGRRSSGPHHPTRMSVAARRGRSSATVHRPSGASTFFGLKRPLPIASSSRSRAHLRSSTAYGVKWSSSSPPSTLSQPQIHYQPV